MRCCALTYFSASCNFLKVAAWVLMADWGNGVDKVTMGDSASMSETKLGAPSMLPVCSSTTFEILVVLPLFVILFCLCLFNVLN